MLRQRRQQRPDSQEFDGGRASPSCMEVMTSSDGMQNTQDLYRTDPKQYGSVSDENNGDSDYVPGGKVAKRKSHRRKTTSVHQKSGNNPKNDVRLEVSTELDTSHNNPTQKRKVSTEEIANSESGIDASPPSKRVAHDKLESVESYGLQEFLLQPLPASNTLNLSEKSVSHVNLTSDVSVLSRSEIKYVEEQLHALTHLVLFNMPPTLTQEYLLEADVVNSLKILASGRKPKLASSARDMVRSANTYRAAQDNMLGILKAAFVRQEPGIDLSFPPIPTAEEVDRGWRAARQGIKDFFTDNLGLSIQGEDLHPVSAGYIACTIDGLLENSERRLNFVASLHGHLKSPHAAQSVTSALFCRWLFEAPDAMCLGQHNNLQLAQYKTILYSDGPAEVQRLDKIAFSSFFADPNFQETTLKSVIENFLGRFDILQLLYPTAPGIKKMDDHKAWAGEVWKLKQRLMISPQDYRVHFCLPETPFDQTWMIAEDEKGDSILPAKVEARTVRICLFPALLEQNPVKFEEGQPIEAALIKSKNMLPSWKDNKAFDSAQVISKAVVLVA